MRPYPLRFVTRSDRIDHLDAEFGEVVSFAARVTSFSLHISVIIAVSSKEKMGRINARWNIATVTYAKTLWNRTVVDFPRIPMSYIATITDAEYPVSEGIGRP